LPIHENFDDLSSRLLQCRDVCLNPGEFVFREFEDATTGRSASVPTLEDVREFGKCEPDAECPLNDKNTFDGRRGIDPISG